MANQHIYSVDLCVKGADQKHYIDWIGTVRALNKNDAIEKCKQDLIKSIEDDAEEDADDFSESLDGYFCALMKYTPKSYNKRAAMCEYYHLDVHHFNELPDRLQDMYKDIVLTDLKKAVNELTLTDFNITEMTLESPDVLRGIRIQIP
jgi:hypothetical protein